MIMGEFKRADIGKLEKFVSDSQEAIKEFGDIRNDFDSINQTLLGNWEGNGQKEYKKVSDHITEQVGNIKDILDTINNQVLKDVIDKYNAVDKDLAEYNRSGGNPSKEG
ncbi:MAG: WXG100 family type VII secretion target [Acutalibacteraceae bacterium]